MAVWATVIFGLSTSGFGGEQTGSILLPVLRWCFPHAPLSQLVRVHAVVRKLAHVTEYTVLSVLWFRALRQGAWRLATAQWLALAGATAYACTDEWHQSFVSNRTAAGMDVLLDGLGAALGQLGLRLFCRIKGSPPAGV